MMKPLLTLALMSALPFQCSDCWDPVECPDCWDPVHRPPNRGDGGTVADAGVDAGTECSAEIRVSFSIDARARPGFYADQELQWVADFSYDEATRTFTPLTGWMDPFAGLWDDGPWTAGGHEPEGADAGDEIFGLSARVAPWPEDITMEYGARLSNGGWIWPPGLLGTVTIPACAAEDITTAGLALPPEGDVDLMLTIDSNDLASGFNARGPFTLQGTFSSWGVDAAHDDGSRGDEVPGDGKFTFVLSQATPRQPRVTSGHVETFYWFIGGDAYVDSSGTALMQGVRAYALTPGSGEFVEVPLFIKNGSFAVTVP